MKAGYKRKLQFFLHGVTNSRLLCTSPFQSSIRDSTNTSGRYAIGVR